MKKPKFPKRLIVIMDSEGETPIAFETPEDISDQLADEPVAIYELVTTGKFNVEKSINAPTPQTINERILDNASHEEMASYVQKIGLKLYTKNMSTKELRRHLREYLNRKKS
jgi:hypothetical protein